ncbi:putative sodium-coupled neutral amino acid transporter 6 [Senna tora]|uniref:Putative sodium-coupled neutral amino acid transporter 6 n=1 Tax=Senna tora TaxID=362788 RepID=A0A834THS9_9FABA|nr:putative sodium-coupled neutral amino acid transporter 6 [Senna tora]
MYVGAFSSSIPAMMDVALMEAVGIKKGIEVAREAGVTHLVIESDSNLVVDMLYSSSTRMSRLTSFCGKKKNWSYLEFFGFRLASYERFLPNASQYADLSGLYHLVAYIELLAQINSVEPRTEKKKSRRNKAVVNEKDPLLPKSQEEHDGFDEFNGASFSGAVFNLSTTIIGAGIMALPATFRELGMVPGILVIIFMAFLTDKSIELLVRFTRAGNCVSYGGLMGDSYGNYGKALVQLCVIVNNIGVLIVYMIIIGLDFTYHALSWELLVLLIRLCIFHDEGDVLSGTSSNGDHHAGILEGWFGFHWWTGRAFVVLFTTLAIFAPLASFKRIDSLRFTSALSVALAVVFLVIAVGISIVKIISGGIGMPRLFPVITDFTSFINLFTVVPVLVTAFICHYNVHNINNELEDSSQMYGVVRTSLALCSSVYLLTSFFGFLLFGEGTLDDVLANFDTDLGIPFGSVLNDAVRLSYAAHLMLVFPVVFYPLRINVDGLLFPSSRPLVLDDFRFASMTTALITLIYLGANFIPSIWDAFQFTGATAAVCLGFIFPAAVTLRDRYNIATKTDKIYSVLMIVLAVFSNAVAIYSDANAIAKKNKTSLR